MARIARTLAMSSLMNYLTFRLNQKTDQPNLAGIRAKTCPSPSKEIASCVFAKTYDQVRSKGIPNEVGSMVPIKTRLDLNLWRNAATGHSEDSIVLSGITYGFSLQYLGPELSEIDIEMHTSAIKYKRHVQAYLDTEIKYGAMVGPFASPPSYHG